MIGRLLWKEWREHRWKLAASLLILVGPLVGQAVYAGARGHSLYGMPTSSIQFATSLGMTIWIAAWTITSERGTRRLLEALPVHTSLILIIKSTLGLATLLVPVWVASTLTGFLLTEPVGDYPLIILAHLYLLILAVGMGIRREGVAAMVGVLVLLASLLTMGILAVHGHGWEYVAQWLFPMCYANTRGIIPFEITIVHRVECATLWLIAGLRFVHGPLWRGRALPTAAAWRPTAIMLGKPSSSLRALIWKEWREQRGVLVGGAAASFAIALAIALARSTLSANLTDVMDILTETLVFVGITIPLTIAIVLGISGWTFDLDPAVATFWQSRPISWTLLFWIKFAFAITGLAALALAFFASAFVCTHYGLRYWSVFDWAARDVTHAFVQGVIWCPLLLTFTMLVQILIRRPIYAGTLAVAACVGVASIRLSGTRIEQEHWNSWLPLLAIAIFFATAGLALAASKSLQKNWRFAT